MHRHDRACPRRHGRRHARDVDEERVRIDVGQDGPRATELDDVGRRRKRVRRDDDLIAWSDAERENRQMESGGSRGDDSRVLRADGLAERALELLDLRPHRELSAREDLLDRGGLQLADVGAREPDVAQGAAAPSRWRYQAIVRMRPSSSSTCASKPSTLRAFSMFGIRSSTSV